MIHNGNTKLVNLRETSVSLRLTNFVLPVKSSILYDHSSGALPPGREAFPRRIKEEQLRLFLFFVIESSHLRSTGLSELASDTLSETLPVKGEITSHEVGQLLKEHYGKTVYEEPKSGPDGGYEIIHPDSPRIKEIEEYNCTLRLALYAQLDKERQRKELLSENSSDKLIFVNIKVSYEAMQRNDREHPLYRNSLYDCTRMYWPISEEKYDAATHILGCYKGKVLEVIIIKNRYIEPSGEYAGRKVFEGVEESDSPYMGMDLHEIFDSLANFRVKYWNIR